ncbi:N-acetylglucosamine-6-phosphate deacetylase [Streptacidiphilus sp. PB12-B1b]|uniref:N-acetylglucosamine-6-phosphate deacetylase n=1 Tax=Streptacidiphilus sp. PB12-B1b TaxID=2705012 RepID=UPI0015FAE66C|nr:N-acetylglucosamine-6-phosphate deacetylase [Streptacidiphilus sp. PB12-B1b]QMU74918.1 N-acetylglucosamine-6-phosphate deacetylase [Streptacidiphilus sp. PB12-B1b]
MSNADRTVLAGARLVLPTGVVDHGRLVVEDGRIAEAAAAPDDGPDGPAGSGGVPPLDLSGYTVAPGFVDLHVHGGGGASYASGIAEEALTAARTHLEHGTTTTMASTVTGEIDEICRQASVLSELVEDGVLAGIHFEGPFISINRCGAHQPDLLRDPDPALVRKLVDAARGSARMLTLAPELEGGIESIRLLRELGVIAAIGHTDANYDKTLAGIEAGATVATHLFNAMPAIGHRAPGPIVALLEDERITVELVGDGVHLHPAVIDLAMAGAGLDRVALITDAMSAAGFGDGLYPLGPLQVRVQDGVARLVEGGSIAGSTLTLDVAFRRAVTVNGLTPERAAQVLSLNPARLLGIADRVGSLEPGKNADLVVLDDAYQLVAVMRRGEWIVGADRFAHLASV